VLKVDYCLSIQCEEPSTFLFSLETRETCMSCLVFGMASVICHSGDFLEPVRNCKC